MSSRKIQEKYLKLTLQELHKDGVIDCNQYQADDFYNLLERVIGDLQFKRGICQHGVKHTDECEVCEE